MSRTFNATEFDFDAEVTRLDEQIEKLQEQLTETESDSHAKVLSNRRGTLKSHRQGAIWARDHAAASDDFPQWDEDVDSVTLGGLRAGTFGQLHDDVGDSDAGSGTAKIMYVADGTVEAPYVDESMSDAERVSAVRDLHPMYLLWAEDRINQLMDPSGNVTPSGDSPGASEQTQTDS